MAAPSESSPLLPRSEIPDVHQAMPALRPYVRNLPENHHPSFEEIKYLPLPEASDTARVAFGLLALLYLICEPEEQLPQFATPWDEFQESERRQTRHANLEASILRYWEEFEQDEAEKDLEELLWTEFLLDGDSDKVLRGTRACASGYLHTLTGCLRSCGLAREPPRAHRTSQATLN